MERNDLNGRRDSRIAGRSGWQWIIVGTALLVVLIAALLPRARVHPPAQPAQSAVSEASNGPSSSGTGNASTQPHRLHSSHQVSAEQVVADKLARFAAERREVVHRLARRAKVQVPAVVEGYFDALEAGRREEALALFKHLSDLHRSPAGSELQPFWRAIVEAQGAAEQVQSWPAQQLLDYGNAVLGSLRPGMVYVGGTDPGCFIPLMLNDTSDGEQHIMLTQNALADGSYLDYLSALYGNQLTTLTSGDSERAFADYVADAQKRLLHDQSLPNEPPQVLPGEAISIEDGKVQVSGQVAVMLINERLLQNLMDSNPGLSFALEESFPFKSTYAKAAPLGPVMELGAASQNALTPDTAAQTVAFWQDTTDQLLADPEGSGSTSALNAYAKMMVAQANLLVSHDLAGEAEQTFRLADQLAPGNPEVVFQYVQLLMQQNRFADAQQVVAGALSAAPENQQFQALNQQLQLRASGK
jgi:hypothetical protein